MKYIVILGDGMADRPVPELGGKTPLEYAKTPTLDSLAAVSVLGAARTIPEGMKPGSDTANLAVMGYDPKKYYTGRSPLEALSIGVDMKDTDIAIRCNLVTVSDDDKPYGEKTIIDHSSGEISTEDATVLLDAVRKELADNEFQFYAGVSYRHLLIWDKGSVAELTPPHDILGKVIGEYLPENDKLRAMMEKSYDILNDHPINVERAKLGLNKANSIWFWGAGTKPGLTSFEKQRHLKGAMISAVDLLKGIAVGAGMTNIDVPGANGQLNTNYYGKAKAAVKAVLEDGFDFVYVHVEAPDEMGHQGSASKKVKSIEYLDQKLIAVVREEMDRSGEDYRLLIMPDHPTPVSVRTHTTDPVPFLLYDSTNPLPNMKWKYNEKDMELAEIYMADGYKLMDELLR